MREEEVFNYIHNILSIPGHSAEEKQSVWQKAMNHMEELVSLKPCKAAELVATHFSEQIEVVIGQLQNQLLLFKFLRSLLDPREGVHVNQELLQIPPHITEQFIELLCQFSPDQVIQTLQVLECYRLEETIQITQKYQLHEVTAYLLEKKGDAHGAFLLLLEVEPDWVHCPSVTPQSVFVSWVSRINMGLTENSSMFICGTILKSNFIYMKKRLYSTSKG